MKTEREIKLENAMKAALKCIADDTGHDLDWGTVSAVCGILEEALEE